MPPLNSLWPSVFNSKRAVQDEHPISRAFVQIRELLAINKELVSRVEKNTIRLRRHECRRCTHE